METPSVLPPQPRLRISRFPQPYFLDTSPHAGPSRLSDSYSPIADQYIHENDDHENQEDTPKLAASTLLPNIISNEQRNPEETPAERLKALLSLVPNDSTVKARRHPPLAREPSSASTMDLVSSDSDVVQVRSAQPSLAHESLKTLFSRALRDPDTPQKGVGGRARRRNSIDTSEVEASPRVERVQRDRTSLKGKRKSMSDDELDPSFKFSQTNDNIKHSQASTFQLLRERLSASALQNQSIFDIPSTSDSFLRGLDSPHAPATSTPQHSAHNSLKMSLNSQFQSNLLDQDSEMQQAMDVFDSYEDPRSHGKHKIAQNLATLIAPSNRRGADGTVEDSHHHQTKSATSNSNHRHSLHSPALRGSSPVLHSFPRRTLSRHGSSMSIGSVDSLDDDASQSGSVGSQSEYRELLKQRTMHEREREWKKPRPRTNSNASVNSLNERTRTHSMPSPSRPSSRLSISSPHRLRSSSRTGSSTGSNMSIESEVEHKEVQEIVHERERNWNSPRPLWDHVRSRTNSDASVASVASSPSPVPPAPTPHFHRSTSSSRLRAQSLKEKARSPVPTHSPAVSPTSPPRLSRRPSSSKASAHSNSPVHSSSSKPPLKEVSSLISFPGSRTTSTSEEQPQPSFELPSTPPRSSFSSTTLPFQTPTPPNGLPELPNPPLSNDDTDSAENDTPHELKSINTTALKTPKPPGAWSYTPAPQHSLPRLEEEPQHDSGLATPVSSLSRGTSVPPKTPALPGGWMATPYPKSVRFEKEESALVSDSSVESESSLKRVTERVRQQLGTGQSQVEGVKAHFEIDGSENDGSTSTIPTPPPSNPVSPSSKIPRVKRRSIVNILDEYGREISDDKATPKLKGEKFSSPPRSSVRVLDATGREIYGSRSEHTMTVDENGEPLSRAEALSRLREGLHDLAQGFEEAQRYPCDRSFTEGRIKELKSESEHARRTRKRLQHRILDEEELKKNFIEPLRASMRRSKIAAPTPMKSSFSWLPTSWIWWIFLVQILLIFIMYRISVSHATHYFLTTYYDPYYPDLHLYHMAPEYPHQSVTEVFWREGVRASAIQMLDNILVFISRLHNSAWRLWGTDDLHLAMAWPPT